MEGDLKKVKLDESEFEGDFSKAILISITYNGNTFHVPAGKQLIGVGLEPIFENIE
jgi:hypothetical protein